MCITPSGITEMRNAYMEKEEAKKMKQKLRDRMTAKTGRMDIAYEVRDGTAHSTACPECVCAAIAL
jgi:elongation factor P--beta-lysine ligase